MILLLCVKILFFIFNCCAWISAALEIPSCVLSRLITYCSLCLRVSCTALVSVWAFLPVATELSQGRGMRAAGLSCLRSEKGFLINQAD